LKQQHRQSVWTDWEPALRSRRPAAVMRARRQLAAEIRYQVFLQYQFDRQWSALRATCRRLGITLLGDLPMFVSHDSADVWANPELFLLDRRGHRIAVAGVPPDAFSRTGQLWGNPLYRWKRMQQSGFAWHLARIRRNLRWYDVVRLDHFIGLYRCWRVDARARTARRGRFVRVPGDKLLTDLRRALGGLPFVAEDLGLMIPEVHALRDQFGLPGMRVLQFGFDADGGRLHQPHRYPPCSVAYTGTHDNDTLVGWIRGASSQRGARARRQVRERRRRVLRYAGSDGREIHWDLIRVVLMSAANTTVFPVQDLLGLGCRARMNRPGTASGNWEWRLRSDELTPHIAERLGLLCEDYERTGGAAGLSSNAASRQRD
jgi:4-alpha-glucanotransferase